MAEIKRRLRGQAELGAAIDERLRRGRTAAELQDSLGAALPVPQSGGGSTGGGGESGDEPAYPEGWVESVAAGEGSPPRGGRLELQAGGTLTLDEEAGPGGGGGPDWRLLLESSSLLEVAALPASGESAILYHLLDDGAGGDGGIWWDAQADGAWRQLSAAELWQREEGVLSPANAGDRVVLATADSPGFSRGALEVEYSGSALQNSAGRFEASSSSGLVYAIDARCASAAGFALFAANSADGTALRAISLGGGPGVHTNRVRADVSYDTAQSSESPPSPPDPGFARLYAMPAALWLAEAAHGPWALLHSVRAGAREEGGPGGYSGSGGTGAGGSGPAGSAALSRPRLALIPGPGLAVSALDINPADPYAAEMALTLSAAPLASAALSDSISSSAAELAFPGASASVPAASLAPGSLLRISARGVFSCANSASGETLRLRLYAGSTLLLDSGAQLLAPAASPAGRAWQLSAELLCASAGSAGSLDCAGRFDYHPTAAGLGVFELTPPAAPVGLSTISALNLSLTAQWNNALASNSITLRQWRVEAMAPAF